MSAWIIPPTVLLTPQLGLSLLCPGCSSSPLFTHSANRPSPRGQDAFGQVGLLGHDAIPQLIPASASQDLCGLDGRSPALLLVVLR